MVFKSRIQAAQDIARESGLMSGARSEIVRGRMPRALVQKAKSVSGVRSNTELIEVALANLAIEDQYVDWLLSRRGSISKAVDLEF